MCFDGDLGLDFVGIVFQLLIFLFCLSSLSEPLRIFHSEICWPSARNLDLLQVFILDVYLGGFVLYVIAIVPLHLFSTVVLYSTTLVAIAVVFLLHRQALIRILRNLKSGPKRPTLARARCYWNKGLEKVIEAMPLLTKEFGRIELLIVGPDYAGYSANLLSMARKLGVHDSVVMTGKVSDEELLFYYSVADVFLLPSLYEGLSTSLLEAMASHVPVIASRFGGSGDVLVEVLMTCS